MSETKRLVINSFAVRNGAQFQDAMMFQTLGKVTESIAVDTMTIQESSISAGGYFFDLNSN